MKDNEVCCYIWCSLLGGGCSPQQLKRWIERAYTRAKESGGKKLSVEIAHHPDDYTHDPPRLCLTYVRRKTVEEHSNGTHYEYLNEDLR